MTNDVAAKLETDFSTAGFALYQLKALSGLSTSVWLTALPEQHGSLLLLGQAGKSFWPAYQASQPVGSDPVDHYSAAVSEQILVKHLPDTPMQRLFPSNKCPVNLMVLGRELGWHAPSPLGMGMHQQYGLWSAYRALWWLGIEAIEIDSVAAEKAGDTAMSICADCQTQECVSHCPASAVRYGSMPDITRCADYRYQPDSSCQSVCLARLACPVAAEHRYTDEQLAYHYDLERSMLYRYRGRRERDK